MWKRIRAITKARTLEFLRDHSNVAFTLLLPFALIVGFKYGYSDNEALFRVGHTAGVPELLAQYPEIKWKSLDLQEGKELLRFQRIDLMLDDEAGEIWVNPHASKSKIVEKLIKAESPREYRKSEIAGDSSRYIDWLFPGILAMNLMFACLNGIGYVIVRYRITGVLKRYLATPMSASEFLFAQMLSRLLIVLFTNAILYFGCISLFGLKAEGSHLLILLITVIGSFNMMAIGLLMATRTKSEEVAASLLNVVGLPMMFVSGTWFPVEDLSPVLAELIWWIPMTHLNEAFRAVMLHGAGLTSILEPLAFLAISGVAVLAFSASIFRWSNH